MVWQEERAYKELPMKVFLSWSGARSRAAALMLRQWLPDIIQSLEPWMSAEDIDAGVRWGNEITNQLEVTRCGIICLTKENQRAPWILFEAGALSKTIEKTYVIPYLIDLEPSDILRGPLTQFQAKRANKNETWELLCTLNGALDNPLADAQLQRGFDRCWSELEAALKDLPEPTSHPETRSEGDKLTEVIEVVRTLARAISDDISPRLESLTNSSRAMIPTYEKAFYELSKEARLSQHITASIINLLNSKSPQTMGNLTDRVNRTNDVDIFRELWNMKKYGLITYPEPLNRDTLISLVEDEDKSS
jgi:hypothetical protein